jgi:hypothetical protein
MVCEWVVAVAPLGNTVSSFVSFSLAPFETKTSRPFRERTCPW